MDVKVSHTPTQTHGSRAAERRTMPASQRLSISLMPAPDWLVLFPSSSATWDHSFPLLLSPVGTSLDSTRPRRGLAGPGLAGQPKGNSSWLVECESDGAGQGLQLVAIQFPLDILALGNEPRRHREKREKSDLLMIVLKLKRCRRRWMLKQR